MLNELTDEDLMPYGKYYGKKMRDLPDKYLEFLYQMSTWSPLTKGVLRYIEEFRPHLVK